jgi:hypothetical protein
MTRTLPDLFGRASTVAADHARLRALWKRLRNVAFEETHDPPSHEEKWHLIWEFACETTEHFTAEEASAHFGALEEQCRELRPKIAELRKEHAQITLLIYELLIARGTAKPAEQDEKLRSLLERYQQHEEAEAAVFRLFFTGDRLESQ